MNLQALRLYTFGLMLLVPALGCRASSGTESAALSDPLATTDFNAEGYKPFPGMNADILGQKPLFDYMRKLGVDVAPACGQLVLKKGDPESMGHLWWSRHECPHPQGKNILMPYEKVEFDFNVHFMSGGMIKKLATNPLHKLLGEMIASGMGGDDMRVGFVADVSEPTQIIGFWAEAAAEKKGGLSDGILYSLCTTFPDYAFIPFYQFHKVCELQVNKETKALAGLKFFNPTPIPAPAQFHPEVRAQYESYRSSGGAGWSPDMTDFSDYDRSASHRYRQPDGRAVPYAQAPFNEKVARMSDAIGRAHLATGNVSGYFEQRQASEVWRQDTRKAIGYGLLKDASKSLLGR